MTTPTSGGIPITEENYLALRKAYRKAVAENKEEFRFQGRDYVTIFIKHVLEHMEMHAWIKPLINQPDK